jgi:hypothetical protein
MTDKDIEKLEAWAVATGNWIFHRDLIAYLKIINRKDFEEILIARSLSYPQG